MTRPAALQKPQAPSRDGKKRISIPVEPEFHKRVKMAAILADETLERWVMTAIEMRLGVK